VQAYCDAVLPTPSPSSLLEFFLSQSHECLYSCGLTAVGVVSYGARDPLGVQQYICCYFTLELDKVSQQSLMSNIFMILHTMVTCISCHFMRVTQINSMSFCALLAPNSGDATAYGGIEY